MKNSVINDDSSSMDSSFISMNNSHCFNIDKPSSTLKDLSQNIHELQSCKKPHNITSRSSNESHFSHESTSTTKIRSLPLNRQQQETFRQRIKQEYESLRRSETNYCYYVDDSSSINRAIAELKRAPNGTFFIQKLDTNEQDSDIKYILHFVSHRRTIGIGICCDKNHKNFWFKSGYGHGSEVKRVYTGIDVLIQHKKENLFHELEYPFQICLYRPIDYNLIKCIPLPDKVRAMGGQNTILHDLVIDGLTQYFNELIRISQDDINRLKDEAQFIVNKINGRNKQGLTPLILAIQAKKYDFIELLLDNKVDVDITDIQGCSPIHYACRQANPIILKKLMDRGADPHYFNPKKSADGTGQFNLSAFHYLAMAKEASIRNIKRCALYLVQKGCPLMPLTNDGKSPFDFAETYNNNAFQCVKTFMRTREFNNLTPIEVSSRNEAKTLLNDLASRRIFGKLRLKIKQLDNADCFASDGLFIYYKVRRSRNQPNDEFGLCVYYSEQVFVYPITQKYSRTITDLSDPPRNIIYKFSLITDTFQDEQVQIILFRNCEELIYSHTKYQGILPTLLNNFVGKHNGETITMEATSLLIINDRRPTIIEDETSDIEDDDNIPEIDINSIHHFNISQIHSLRLLEENNHRFIWVANVRFDSTISFPIVIKDYLPNTNIDSYKRYRLNEFNTENSTTDNDEFPYKFSSRTRRDYNHESKLLLNELKNYPLIVHTFICDQHLKRDLRIFMEYLPLGNLHSYLIKLDQNSLDPLINAFHWIYQLAQVMGYLSTKKIVHRDLATRNILLKTERYIKLSDFGLSRIEGVILEEKDCTISPRWTAPECLVRDQTISSFADVWSFGIVIWEIFSFGIKPYETDFNNNNNSQPINRMLKRFIIEQGRRLSQPDPCSEGMYDLMCRCWNINIEKRPRFVDIIDDLNGIHTKKDCIIPFTREERKLWKEAKKEYYNIIPSIVINSTNAPEYVLVEDTENDIKDNNVTEFRI